MKGGGWLIRNAGFVRDNRSRLTLPAMTGEQAVIDVIWLRHRCRRKQIYNFNP